ncbi:hypothetical protein D3C76_689580 [compost metagenome]
MYRPIADAQQLAGHRCIVTLTGGRIEDRQAARRAVVFGAANAGCLRTVRELQTLDAGQAIDAVTSRHQIGHNHRIAFDNDVVLRRSTGEQRGVEAVVAGQNLPLDDQLPWVVCAVEHERHQRLHAVERGDFRASAIGILPHADAHVQPFVTIDDVVTAAPFDQVAAAATKNDVATVEERRSGWQQIRQAVDQADVGQHTAGCTGGG